MSGEQEDARSLLRRVGDAAVEGVVRLNEAAQRNTAAPGGVPAGSSKRTRQSTEEEQRLRTTVTDALRRQFELVQGALVYGIVLDILDHVPGDLGAGGFPTLGTPVRVLDGEKTGKAGVALQDPDEHGEVLVNLEDGSLARFGVGVEQAENPKRQIEVDPAHRKRVVVALESRQLQVQHPLGADIEIGDTVALNKDTLQIVSVIGRRDIGEIAMVHRRLNDESCEVAVRGALRVVSTEAYKGQIKGDERVLLDPSLSTVIALLPDIQPMEHRTTAPVSWGDIGGQDNAIAALQDAFADVSGDGLEGFYRSTDSRGGVLGGPPGCGKTLLARALITHLMQQHVGKGAPFTHLYFKGPELLASLVGRAEAALRSIHAACRKVHDEYGFWPVLLWDECEALFKKRGSGISSDATDSIVNTQLVETDGVEGGGAPNFYLTNRVDLLDPALIREGRVDIILDIGRPDRQGVERIFAIHLKRMPIGGGDTVQTLAAFAAAELFDRKYSIYVLTVGEKGNERSEHFTLGKIVSGAMVADIVKKAARLARKDDRDRQTRNGMLRTHVIAAVHAKFCERIRFDHLEDLRSFREKITDPVQDITKQKQIQG